MRWFPSQESCFTSTEYKITHTEYKHAFEDTNVINKFINDLYTTEKKIIIECREINFNMG